MSVCYSQLGRATDKLFRAHFRYGPSVKAKSVADDGVGFDISLGAGKKPGVIVSNLGGKIQKGPLGLSLHGNIDSANKWWISASQDDKILKGLQVTAKMIRADSNGNNNNGGDGSGREEHAVIGGRYKRGWGTGRMECELRPTGGQLTTEIAIQPRKGARVGGRVIYKLGRGDLVQKTRGQFEKGELRGEYAASSYVAFGKLDTVGDLTLAFVQKWDSKLSVGGLYEHKAQDGYNLFTLGASYNMSPSTIIKGNVSSSGLIEAALAHQLNEYVDMVGAVQINTALSGSEGQKFGLSFILHDSD